MESAPQEEVLAHVPYHATRCCTRRPPAEGSHYWCTDRPEDKVAFGVELEGRAWVKEVELTVVGASHVEIRGAEGVETQYRDARRIMKKREVRDMFAFKANTSPENRVVLTPTDALDAQLTYGCLFIALFNHWDPLVPLGVKDLRIVGACDTQNCASQPHPPSLAPTLSVYNPHKPVAAWKAATAVPDAVPKAAVAVPAPMTQLPAVASQQPSVLLCPPAAAPRPKPVPAVPAAAAAAASTPAAVAPVAPRPTPPQAAVAAAAASAAPPRAPAAFQGSSFKTPGAQSAKAAYLSAAAAFDTGSADKAPPAPLQATLPQLPQTLQQPSAPAPAAAKPVQPQAGFTPAPFVPLGAAPAPPCVAPPQPPPQQPAAVAWNNPHTYTAPPAPPQEPPARMAFESAPAVPPPTQKPLDGVTVCRFCDLSSSCVGGFLTFSLISQICLSGFVNPERSQLRQAALSLGASFVDDFRQGGTHLIAAFPDTPKARDVAASGSGFIVSAAWLREAVQKRKRPDEAPHALAPPAKKAKKMYAVP